ncbi:MAG: hypothetical protein H6Q51_53 [Deltaproteobacteria bacterium]|nr:hypothetical protein [Deltaproteobacteria bacterium]
MTDRFCGNCRWFAYGGQPGCDAVEGIRPNSNRSERCVHDPERWELRDPPEGGRSHNQLAPYEPRGYKIQLRRRRT